MPMMTDATSERMVRRDMKDSVCVNEISAAQPNLWPNSCFETALAVGVLPHCVFVANGGTHTLGSHSFIGLLKICSPRRCGIHLCRLRGHCYAQKRYEHRNTEQRFHV